MITVADVSQPVRTVRAINEARRRRGAKQHRRDARRARKRQAINADDDILVTTIRSVLAGHPGGLLGLASHHISLATPEPPSSTADSPDGTGPLASLISGLVERPCRETTALLAVLAEMLVDHDVLRERCRRAGSTRRDHLAKWIVGLPDVEVRRVVRSTDALGEGDELAFDLVLADATELTLCAFLDHRFLSTVTDFVVLPGPLDEALGGKIEWVDPTTPFVEMNPADARSWTECGLGRGEYLLRPGVWREAIPLVRWMTAQLPGGGTSFERLEWESGILRYPDDHYGVPLEIALDTPALLRAYVPFAHADSGIRRDLTDQAVATIDEMGRRYRRELLDAVVEHYDDDDIAPPPWLT
jgi:hypothetical protein